MKLLEERILKDGKIKEGDILKVDSFINHQIDIPFIDKLGEEFYRIYGDQEITKILTIEASGIAIASIVAQHFNVPILFAKKNMSINIAGDVYKSKVQSYTHKKEYNVIVSKEFLHPDDKVLIIDDFLAKGSALNALIKLIKDAGATIVGAGIVIEKVYQGGGKLIRDMGVRVESLAKIKSLNDIEGTIEFTD